MILSEASFPDDICGRNKTKNFLSFLPHMSFVKSSRRLTLVPVVLRVLCEAKRRMRRALGESLKSYGQKSCECGATRPAAIIQVSDVIIYIKNLRIFQSRQTLNY